MFFFRRLSQGLPHNIRYKSGKERFARSLALCLAILLVCWGFWRNSGNYIKKFSLEQRIDDGQKTLGNQYKSRLAELLDRIETKYGIKIYVKISPLPVVSANALPDAILLGLSPKNKQFALLMPESWEASLGKGFVLRLRDEVMLPSLTREKAAQEGGEEAWKPALLLVLEKLEKRLRELAGPGKDDLEERF
jgi:hypothetical protein